MKRLMMIPMLALMVGMAACSGCASTNPLSAADGIDERGYAVMGMYNAFQKEVLKVALDESLPANVRLAAADADKAAVDVIGELSSALALYQEVQLALAVGDTPQEDLAAVIAHLTSWVEQGQKVVTGLKRAVEDAARLKKKTASTATPFHFAHGAA